MNWRKIILLFVWPVYRLFMAIFFKFKVKGRENLRNLNKPFIIASNHASYMDPELIAVAFSWNSKFFPIRYITGAPYYNKLILGTIIWILGGFPVVQGIGLDKSLASAIYLLKDGDVVGVFPEGKKTRDGTFSEAKPGVAYLALKTGLPILPVGVSGTFGLSVKTILFDRRKIAINFGKPFYLKDFIGDINPDPEKDKEILIKGAQIAMEKIKELTN